MTENEVKVCERKLAEQGFAAVAERSGLCGWCVKLRPVGGVGTLYAFSVEDAEAMVADGKVAAR